MPLRQITEEQQKFESNKKDYKRYGWKNIAIKIKENDLVFLTDNWINWVLKLLAIW